MPEYSKVFIGNAFVDAMDGAYMSVAKPATSEVGITRGICAYTRPQAQSGRKLGASAVYRQGDDPQAA